MLALVPEACVYYVPIAHNRLQEPLSAMTQQELEALFAVLPRRGELTPEQKGKKDVIRHNLQKTFKEAAIQVALDMPPEYEKARERFIEHVWKAYTIAASVHNEIFMLPPEIIGNINEYVLTRFYRSLWNDQGDNSSNDSKA